MSADYNRIITSKDQQHLNVLRNQAQTLKNIQSDLDSVRHKTEQSISDSEALLQSLGIAIPTTANRQPHKKPPVATNLQVRDWEDILSDAELGTSDNAVFLDILNVEEIQTVERKISGLRAEFLNVHRLDKLDWAICGVAGILAAIIDVFLVKMPKHPGFLGGKGSQGGALSNFVREKIQAGLTPDQIKQLERDNWAPFDASHSGSLGEKVAGLGARTHRYQSLGHDPILGFIVGTMDILKGQFTAVDKYGKIIVQNIDTTGKDTVGMNIFEALARVFGHMKSDVATSAGLPVPLMPLFQFMQFGRIGEQEYTIGEMSRIMYRQGYNFTHFLSMSIPVIMIEVIVRLCYFAKRMYEGHGFLESIPFSTNPSKNPKLQTMLFSAHLIATSVNAGKVAVTKNPLAINYPQWTAFFKYGFQHIKWVAYEKEQEMLKHVQKDIDQSWEQINAMLETSWGLISNKPIITL
ncbi:hypothetical protein [Paenibacillus soyae]|uniref:Uncharacterized protein n=1 Tax=Paenibacillus soyae TaxID=2969249 RepID=A0A9X2MWH5_9BACL|nr:hypothetical protein [Paenibacillus soyae]MCR2807715.1 hypothetical protein [Paenibacillus soyae]